MSLQYIADGSGRPTAVIIPIDEWNKIREKHPDIETIEGELPQWQKDVIDPRLKKATSSDDLRPIDELLDELNKED
ncbi:hypothetical protein GCM10023093_22220 [Nemorincola caseinilytica]|uniref:Uncharacterized protein n=1 Tax=Nemorincola caseinilytica TaxID=2054315 RepID=A0ABP8NK82_9BACT